jgi:cytochrome o ubiquinol oxidase subunit 1
LIWYIWWLAIVSFIGIIVCLILRVSETHTEFTLTAEEVAIVEAELAKKGRS